MTTTEMVVLPHDASACSQARRWVADHLDPLGLDPALRYDVVLCVDELVSNVVDHTFSEPVVTLTVGEAILVEVDDANSVPPSVQAPTLSRPRGRGLQIVDGLADRWGAAVRDDGGKVVWFSVPVPGPLRAT